MVDKLVEELREAIADKMIELGYGMSGVEDQLAQACAAIAQKRVNELEAALKQIASGEVGGDPDEPFSGYMRCRKIALDALALPTPEVPGESEEEMK